MASQAESGTAARSAASPTLGLRCVVVTPERTVLDEPVDFVAIPLYDGELGVLPGRSPLIARLGFGELRVRADGSVRRYFVEGGFVQIRDDVVTLLTNRSLPAHQIDAAAVARELEHIQDIRAITDQELAEKSRKLERERALLRVSRHRSDSAAASANS